MEELKNLVVETLDKNGSLDSIRAQLRSSVFGAIQSEQKKNIKTEASKIMETEVGEYSAELLRDFLEKTEAVHTLHVFSLESQLKPDSKLKLSKKFGLVQESTPALFKLIRDFKANFKPSQEAPRPAEDFKQEAKFPAQKKDQKRQDEEQSDNYTEDFEEIEEDIEITSQDTGGKESHRYYESGGSSGGVDPSVDSLALDQCDYLEAVKRPRN